MKGAGKYIILRVTVLVVFVIMGARLFHIQIIDNSYKRSSDNNDTRCNTLREVLCMTATANTLSKARRFTT